MYFSRYCITAASLVTAVCAVALPNDLQTRQDVTPVVQSASIPATIVAEFPKGNWLENFVIRQSDGNAVVTFLSAPEVWLISTTSSFDPIKIAEFPGNLGVLGITELGHDHFYVNVGNWSAHLAEPTPGSWSIWEIDLTEFNNLSDSSTITTREVAKLPEAGFLNGLATLNPITGTLLAADSLFSTTWSISTHTGQVTPLINTTSMSPDASLATLALGINALTLHASHLYYTNTDLGTFSRLPISPFTGLPTGPVVAATTLADNAFPDVILDDFTLDFAGNAWVASGRGEVLLLRDVVRGRGAVKAIEVVAGSVDDERITGHTAVKFGTSKEDLERGSLYATTSGGAVGYITGNFTAGGMLVRYDVGGLIG